MKKIWLFCACLLLMGTLAAQTGVGIRAGKSFARVNFAPTVPSQSFTDGYEGGVLLRFMNTRHLGIQLELNMSSQGWHVYPAIDSLAHQKQLQYVQLPILSHVQLGGGRLRFVVQGGAFIAYAFAEKDVRIPQEGVLSPVAYRQQPFQPWQYGVLAAAGPAFRFNFGELQLEARFAQHLSNLLEADFSKTSDFDDSQQQIITFGLQWLYTF